MKTLIYDNECPLCVAYTGAFVKTGLLQKEGRKNFNEIDEQLLQSIDATRMHNEIPLIENETGKVWYGIDALLEIIGNKMPFIKTIGQVNVVNWFLKKIYKLVSFNRKVIVAVSARGYDCSPRFNIKYRLLFLIAGLLLNSWLFTLYIPLFNKSIFPLADASHMQLAHFIFVGINISIAAIIGKTKGLEYLGQVNMLALLTMLLLAPVYFLQNIIPVYIIFFSFGGIGLFIAKEYIRRMRYAGILNEYKMIVMANIICVGGFLGWLGCF